MIAHANINLLLIDRRTSSETLHLDRFLNAMAHVHADRRPHLPEDLSPYDAVLTAVADFDAKGLKQLTDYVLAGNGWIMLIAPEQEQVPAIFGADVSPAGPSMELRLHLEAGSDVARHRLPETFYVQGRHRALMPVDDATEVLIYADWRYKKSPVFIQRRSGEGQVAATTLQALDHPILQKVLYRRIWQLTGHAQPVDSIGVGVLGYAPSVGRLHGLGAMHTEGLEMRAICDHDRLRREQARGDFPDLPVYESAERLCEDPTVQLVIVATPPHSHAELTQQILSADRHVVCEKPLALHSRETESMRRLAEQRRLLLCCHQNRRFDVDYLAIKKALGQGLMGDLFYLETFVGGFHHPCGYWHSHAPISGGTTYDWGAHFLDWIVGLAGSEVATVQGVRHKRVWHDITNADQERILIRFDNGCEAEFLHSDIAAARKPKWYLLGTRGAIVGHWQDVTSHLPHPVHYYESHDIPATEMPPRLILSTRDERGAVTSREMALASPEPFGFHRNLADHILWGEPLAAPLEDSIKVVAILEAAARSAAAGGAIEVLHA